jgi:hypothetical protein
MGLLLVHLKHLAIGTVIAISMQMEETECQIRLMRPSAFPKIVKTTTEEDGSS